MTIALVGANGLFTRIGHLGGLLNLLNSHRGTDVPAHITTIIGDFPSTNRPDLADGLTADKQSYQQIGSSFASALKQRAQNILIGMADDDAHLTSKTLAAAMATIISQIQTSVDTVQKTTVGSSVTAGGSNNGNAVIMVSAKNPKGLVNENIFQETLTLTCTADGQSGGRSRAESISVKGQGQQSDPLMFDWPLGSAAVNSLTVIDAQLDNQSQGNILTNGDFEAFTVTNIPDNWRIAVGTAGTTVFKASSGYTQLAALQITGNGSELTNLTQQFGGAVASGATAGTAGTLSPETVYALNGFLKVSSVPAAGVLEIAFVDGSDTIINDEQGVANSVSKTLSAATTSYVALNAFFRTPRTLPSTVKLRIRLSTALTNAVSVFVDDLGLAVVPSPIYTGGPYVAVFAASTNVAVNDTWAVAMTNTYAGGFIKVFERFFGMRALGMLIPSGSSASISDGLIV